MKKITKASIASFIKFHRIEFIVLLLAIAFYFIAKFCVEPHTIAPAVTAFRLISMIVVTLSIFIFCARRRKLIFANLSMIALLVLCFEFICFALLGFPSKSNFDFKLPDLAEDHIALALGFVGERDSVVHDSKMIGEELVFDVDYTVGHNYERVTPDYDSTKSKYALFFGCSIGFGYGLEDDQTLAYQFQQNSDYNAYNYAYSGYGTNQMLARFEYQNLREFIPQQEQEGAAFYIFYWDHIQRAIGTMDRYGSWVYNSPFYERTEDGVKRNKSFKDGRPVISTIYENLYQSSIIKYFEIDFPMSLKERHLDLVSEMVVQSKKMYHEQFGNDEFYVVIYPTYDEADPENLKRFLEILKEKGIAVMNLHEEFDYDWSYAIHTNEPHPGAKANAMIGKLLADDYTNILEK